MARAEGQQAANRVETRQPASEITLILDRRIDARGNEGPPFSTLKNVLTIANLDEALETYWHNQLTDDFMIGERRLVDHDAVRLKLYIAQTYGFEPSTTLCTEAITLSAVEHAHHPVRDYLHSLRWDGVCRLDTWLVDYFRAEDLPHTGQVGRKMLVAAVARVMEPGAKWDYTLILEGPQRRGKSKGIHLLSPRPEWVVDLEVCRDEKRMQEIISTAWLVELGELRGLSNADVRNIKSFLSREADVYRKAYGRFLSYAPRQCLFVGTTNETNYLRDETGNRRFIPIRMKGADLAAIQRDRDQLWAEALVLFCDGEILEWDDEVLGALKDEQEERLEHDDWEGAVADYLATLGPGVEKVTTRQVAFEALSVTLDKLDVGSQRRLATIMRRLGWINKTIRIPGNGTARGYVRGGPDEEPPDKPERSLDSREKLKRRREEAKARAQAGAAAQKAAQKAARDRARKRRDEDED
jgi:predicted P-loop ATPase